MADDAPPALPPREAATPPELPPREAVEAMSLAEEDVADLDAAAAEGYEEKPRKLPQRFVGLGLDSDAVFRGLRRAGHDPGAGPLL